MNLSFDKNGTLPLQALVSDVIYIPLETPLLAAARRRGNPTSNGLCMLLNQVWWFLLSKWALY
jgi:shikimate dehydrogenase